MMRSKGWKLLAAGLCAILTAMSVPGYADGLTGVCASANEIHAEQKVIAAKDIAVKDTEKTADAEGSVRNTVSEETVLSEDAGANVIPDELRVAEEDALETISDDSNMTQSTVSDDTAASAESDKETVWKEAGVPENTIWDAGFKKQESATEDEYAGAKDLGDATEDEYAGTLDSNAASENADAAAKNPDAFAEGGGSAEDVMPEEVQIITGFGEDADQPKSLTFSVDEKPSLEELLSMFPETISVYLDGSQTLTEIPVNYECTGMDYSSTAIYYYQFNPTWDESLYPLTEEIDPLTEVPYYSIFLDAAWNAEPTLSVSAATLSNEDTIFNYLTENMGYNRAAACGVLANIVAESDFLPNAGGDGGTSHGICQWHNSRWATLTAWCKKKDYDPWKLKSQLEYLKYELSGNVVSVLYNGKTINTYMKSVPNTKAGAYDAGKYWCIHYEVPANKYSVGATRGNLAKNTYWTRHPGTPAPLKISDAVAPATLSVGEVFTPEGVITAGLKITKVTASIYDADGTLVVGKTVAPKEKSYNIKTGIGKSIAFGELYPGVYRYKVVAVTSEDKKTLVNTVFTVLDMERMLEDGLYELEAGSNSALVAGIEGSSSKAGSMAELQSRSKKNRQIFYIAYEGNGYYSLRNLATGYYLGVKDGAKRSGTSVTQDKLTGKAQKWNIIEAGDKLCFVPACAKNTCLSVTSGKIKSGQNLQIATSSLAKAQRFQLKEVKPYGKTCQAFYNELKNSLLITEEMLSLSSESYTYNGAAKKPKVKVKTETGKTLKKGTDYKVAYVRNINAGTARAIVHGVGKYSGCAEATYRIKPAKLENCKFSGPGTVVYTGKKLKPTPVIKAGSAKLKRGTDYTLLYSGNKAIGTAKVKITGKGNYTGTLTKTFRIRPPKTKIKSVTAKKKAIAVVLKKCGGKVKYQISIQRKGSNRITRIKTSDPSRVISRLKSGKTYQVRARTYKKVKGKTYYGAWTKQVSVKVK